MSADGTVTATFANNPKILTTEDFLAAGTAAPVFSTASAAAPVASAYPSLQWRWTARTADSSFYSAPVRTMTFAEQDTAVWGALAVGDTSGSSASELLGMTTTSSGQVYADYLALGLQSLYTDRDFRDVRLADLNNDGLDDIVANVYGSGCTVIGLRQPSGGYEFSTPLRDDGSCIGGNGETILVADFDNDGLLDIFLPSYQRFDLLHNLGNGQFVEIADSLGISYPNYFPNAEGAAAVDIDQNGTVDIVVGNEVLLNDGAGHFTAQISPFGEDRVHDEGISVADLDGDGIFDVVRNNPSQGPLLFWGEGSGAHFHLQNAGWLFGGADVMDSSFGLAVADLTGDGLDELVLAGGIPAGTPPQVCVQSPPRHFECLKDYLPTRPGDWQDLLLATDINADGSPDLVARFGTIRIFSNPLEYANVFRLDLRDSNGHRNMQGHAIRATCSLDGSLIALKFVDGGNGYLSQGDYIVPFVSSWCPSIVVEIPTMTGARRFGPFEPGAYIVNVPR